MKGYSQSLSIDETIKYLNTLSSEHPGKDYKSLEDQFDHCNREVTYLISYDKNKISIIEKINRQDCKTSSKNKIIKGNAYFFDADEIDIKKSEIRITKYLKKLVLFGEIGQLQFDTSINAYSKNVIIEDSIYFSIGDKQYLNVFYNGIKYLITLAKANKDEVKDPFLISKYSQNKRTNVISKIHLLDRNGVMILNVKIGSVISTTFILDSGAGECNISLELEKQLKEVGIIKNNDYLENGLFKLADGSIVENRRVKISKIKIGNTIISNIIASVGPSNSPNLLGQSFLKKTNKWSIDNSQKILIIE